MTRRGRTGSTEMLGQIKNKIEDALQWFLDFAMQYLGLSNRTLSHKVVHVVLGVAWEELIFTLSLKCGPFIAIALYFRIYGEPAWVVNLPKLTVMIVFLGLFCAWTT